MGDPMDDARHAAARRDDGRVERTGGPPEDAPHGVHAARERRVEQARDDDAGREQQAAQGARALFGDQFESMSRYVDILVGQGVEWGLLGPREPERIWSRHIMNCAALLEVIGEGVDVIDVGSGAGLPGLVIAIARPDLNVTLLEPLLRRFNFLKEAVDELGLDGQVLVERGRAEDLKQHFDVVTCRAVARLPKLLGLTMPLFLPDGELLALKGESIDEELADSADIIARNGLSAQVMQVRATPEVDVAHILRVQAG